jgi:ribosomal protein S18 acetylase RimI-like enzyme
MSDLECRLADPSEYPTLREMILESFAPITWYRKVDEKMGPLNGHDWRTRWHLRLDKVFATQIILAGEAAGGVVAAATGTVNDTTRLGFIDLLAVDVRHQGKGYGRAMLRGMLDHLRRLGMEHVYLECLTDNDPGNALYASEGWQIVASANFWFTKL